MKIAICDNNQMFREKVKMNLEESYQENEVLVDLFSSGEELINYYQKGLGDFSIVLLDIEMKQLNGVEIAKWIKKFSPEVVFIFLTSHAEFTLTVYEVTALRYLLKPVEKDQLIDAIELAKMILDKEKKILISGKDGECLVKVKDILYIEAQEQVSCIVTSEQTYSRCYPLNCYTDELKEYGFYRIHQSYLVNMNFIKEIVKQEVLLENGSFIPISKLRLNGFTQKFYAYIN